MDQQNLLKAAIVGVLLRDHYLADWHIADMLEIPRDEFGGCGTPGPGNDAIRELVRDGIIQPVIDLSCRYQIAGATIPALEARLAALEQALAECQAQAAALAQADRLTAADLRALARCAETTATMLDGPNDGTTGLMELARKVRQLADNATT